MVIPDKYYDNLREKLKTAKITVKEDIDTVRGHHARNLAWVGTVKGHLAHNIACVCVVKDRS